MCGRLLGATYESDVPVIQVAPVHLSLEDDVLLKEQERLAYKVTNWKRQ